jgi:GT2 family glycosyltransferase
MPDAAIIIPHYNDVTRLTRCLEALAPQLSAQTELVVVDNASTDDLGAVQRAFADVRFVTEPLKGAAAARNRGVVETTAPLIFFLDADCVPEPDWVQNAFAVSGRGDLVGGAVSVFDETPAPRSGAEAFETVFAFNNRRYIEEEGFSVTANLLTRRDVFEDVGPLDGSQSEDVEWCQRAVSKGYTLVYAESLRVSHPSRSDWAALARKWRRMTHEGFGLNGTGGAARVKWAAKALAMPISALVHVPKVLHDPGLRDGQERRAALGTLAALRLQRMIWMLRQVVTGRL